jgi:hypothetical protein
MNSRVAWKEYYQVGSSSKCYDSMSSIISKNRNSVNFSKRILNYVRYFKCLYNQNKFHYLYSFHFHWFWALVCPVFVDSSFPLSHNFRMHRDSILIYIIYVGKVSIYCQQRSHVSLCLRTWSTAFQRDTLNLRRFWWYKAKVHLSLCLIN